MSGCGFRGCEPPDGPARACPIHGDAPKTLCESIERMTCERDTAQAAPRLPTIDDIPGKLRLLGETRTFTRDMVARNEGLTIVPGTSIGDHIARDRWWLDALDAAIAALEYVAAVTLVAMRVPVGEAPDPTRTGSKAWGQELAARATRTEERLRGEIAALRESLERTTFQRDTAQAELGAVDVELGLSPSFGLSSPSIPAQHKERLAKIISLMAGRDLGGGLPSRGASAEVAALYDEDDDHDDTLEDERDEAEEERDAALAKMRETRVECRQLRRELKDVRAMRAGVRAAELEVAFRAGIETAEGRIDMTNAQIEEAVATWKAGNL